jgi:uncharacterized protein YdeI (YjbR/CyaY-like superfamily)
MPEIKFLPEVEANQGQRQPWAEEFEKLRSILRECGLTEDFKWRHPCYTFNGDNVVLIHGFKDYCALLFFQGALLKDPDRVLVRQTENVQEGRQIRFTNLRQITEREPIIKSFVQEAIEIEKSGLKVIKKTTADYPVPKEFAKKLSEKPELKTAFEALTPGRQRAYLFYFAQAKQTATRTARVEKCLPNILKGKGLDDK